MADRANYGRPKRTPGAGPALGAGAMIPAPARIRKTCRSAPAPRESRRGMQRIVTERLEPDPLQGILSGPRDAPRAMQAGSIVCFKVRMLPVP